MAFLDVGFLFCVLHFLLKLDFYSIDHELLAKRQFFLTGLRRDINSLHLAVQSEVQ